MQTEFHRLVGISEDDYELEMEMDVKQEDDEEEEEDEEKNIAVHRIVTAGHGVAGSAINRFHEDEQIQEQAFSQSGTRRCRPVEEKERTKLRERHRRAITARILAGLKKHGNYNLRVRADINDVIAALAREAGWIVLPDGTTFHSKSQQSGTIAGASTTEMVMLSSPMVSQRTPHCSPRGLSPGCHTSLEYNTLCPVKSVYIPPQSPKDASSNSKNSFPVRRLEEKEENVVIGLPIDAVVDKQEHDFVGTPYVPVFVMLPLGVINMKCELVDPDGILKQLSVLKSINVDGVMVDCWWGIVEAHAPQEYNWNGYKRLFQIVRELKLRLQVVMSFHECGGNVDDDVCIPLPHWVVEIGRSNPDIFFTDIEGRRNPECLSWGTDKERVLRGRTAVEVFFDYMRSFRIVFADFFDDAIISMVQIGLGPCGELRYPSFPAKHGWRYPGIGEFQCYDDYMLKRLRKAAEARGHSFWAKGPDNAGCYNSRPFETGFFCDGGDYDGYYGRFFLKWYSQVLVDHTDWVLSLAKLVFEDTLIVAKISGIYWWYKTTSHAAELTAGFYNPCNQDGYSAPIKILCKHGAALNFSCAEPCMVNLHEDFLEAMADPGALTWQIMNAAWDACVPVLSENTLPCHDKEGYNRILENAKPLNDPDGRHLSSFTYLRMCPLLLEKHNFLEFHRFLKRMHGESVLDLRT